MEFRHLRYFVAVADKLSFTRAAAALHVAQPSLTRQIQNLEEEIGVRLLDRSKKHVALTDEGRAFLVDAKRLLALATESIQSVQRLSRGETGQLNIGTCPTSILICSQERWRRSARGIRTSPSTSLI